MVAVGRVVLWTLVLVAPGGFLLVPVLVLQSGSSSRSWRERVGDLVQGARGSVAQLQRYWTKS
ncbi:MAG TPA: hypothetical protein VJN18_29300 [Polyangiaceae bacterium]|nr:hypothetical protein [Polyangiaceae bacterium]